MLGEPIPDLVSTAIRIDYSFQFEPPSGASNMADTRSG